MRRLRQIAGGLVGSALGSSPILGFGALLELLDDLARLAGLLVGSLRRAFGRLIRSRKDRGVVAILDGRILRRNYGATLLGSLPERCPRTYLLDDVRRFFG